MGRDGEAMQAVDTRPALGMTLLKDFVVSSPGADGATPTQWSGTIYNRENGKTYQCNMSLGAAPGGHSELVLHAYVGLPLFGKTQHWQHAPAQTSTASQH